MDSKYAPIHLYCDKQILKKYYYTLISSYLHTVVDQSLSYQTLSYFYMQSNIIEVMVTLKATTFDRRLRKWIKISLVNSGYPEMYQTQ